jgi:NhaP-type Na+/H+ or K+/H+ antiporter
VDLTAVGIVALLVVAYGSVSARLSAWSITGPIAFVAAGVVLGPVGADVVAGGFQEGAVEVLAEATLVVVLFTDATRIDLRRLAGQLTLPARLLGVALPLTVVAGTVVAVVLFPGLSVWEAAVVAAILAPTDAALGAAVVADQRVPVRIRQALNVESGLNDGLMLPAITILAAVAAAELDVQTPAYWISFVARQIGFGVAIGGVVGFVGGWLLVVADDRRWVEGALRQLTTLGVGVAGFAVAAAVGGNGFVAAFVAGLAFGRAAREQCATAADFAEDEGQLLALLTFLFFGALLAGPALTDLTPAVVGYALLSLTVVRMVPVALGVVGVGLEWPTVAYLGWFGPRGLASILFGIVVFEEAAVGASSVILTVVTVTVAASTLLHGLTSVPLAARYGAWFRSMPDAAAMPEGVPVEMMRVRVGEDMFPQQSSR